MIKQYKIHLCSMTLKTETKKKKELKIGIAS